MPCHGCPRAGPTASPSSSPSPSRYHAAAHLRAAAQWLPAQQRRRSQLRINRPPGKVVPRFRPVLTWLYLIPKYFVWFCLVACFCPLLVGTLRVNFVFRQFRVPCLLILWLMATHFFSRHTLCSLQLTEAPRGNLQVEANSHHSPTSLMSTGRGNFLV